MCGPKSVILVQHIYMYIVTYILQPLWFVVMWGRPKSVPRNVRIFHRSFTYTYICM